MKRYFNYILVYIPIGNSNKKILSLSLDGIFFKEYSSEHLMRLSEKCKKFCKIIYESRKRSTFD